MLRLESSDTRFQFFRDVRRVGIGGELKRRAYLDRDLAGACRVAAALFEREEALEADGHDGRAQVCREQTRAGLESVQPSILRAPPFGEDEHAIAAIHRLAGKGEAAAKAAMLRQREDVEERHDQRVLRL